MLAMAGTTAALAAPAAAVDRLMQPYPEINEHPADRIERLSAEMADALAEYAGGQFRAVVLPDGDVSLQNINAPPAMLAEGHARITIGRKAYLIDTADLPSHTVREVRDPECPEWGPGHETLISPRPGSRYVVMRHDGKIIASELSEYATIGTRVDPRVGILPPRDEGAYSVRFGCMVLGRVIDEVVA